MTGLELYNFFTSLNLGYSIDSTLFYSLLGTVKAQIETAREWNIMKKVDVSETATPSDTFLTPKTIPTDFFFWQSEDPIVLVDTTNTNNFINYKEVPNAKKFLYQFQAYRYSCDYANNLLYLGGTVDKNYTIYKNYIYNTPDITDATSWVFPSKYHTILAYGVAALHKLGVDFDDINKVSGDANGKTYISMLKAMELWDARLTTGMMEGTDRRVYDELPGFISGHVSLSDY